MFIELADKLRDLGYRSIVVIHGPGWVQEQLVARGLDPIVLSASGSFALGFLRQLIAIVRAEKVSLIQSHLLGSNVYASIVGLITGIPVVATYHGMVDVRPNERFRRIKNLAMKFGIKRYVAVSRRLMENIEQQNLLDVKKTEVIYNGINLNRYQVSEDTTLRQSLKLGEDAIIVGSLGNVRPAKAYDVLIRAAAGLLDHHKHIHFVVAGHQKEPLMGELQALMDDLGVSANIHFIGFQQDCAAFLGQLDYFLLSSSSEGFSISTIEAMATGLPVLVTRCGGPEEIISAENQGIMVEPNQPSEITKALEALIDNQEYAKELGQNGKKRAQEAFGVEAMLNGYDEIYKQL